MKDAAAMLAVEGSTLYRWTYERRIPTVKLYDAGRVSESA
jgi:hypothetical protein